MRISDWSSDVCSSDLHQEAAALDVELVELRAEVHARGAVDAPDRGAGPLGGKRVEPVEGLAGFRGAESGLERKSVVEGKSVSVRVDFGGRGTIKKNKSDTIIYQT